MNDQGYNSRETEAKWRRTWDGWQIYRYDPSQPRQNTFAVDTPPPTVSGSLHIGHAFSYTHQDLLVRYKRMQGLNVFYPMGWDDNGLPTERRVENYFNVRCNPLLPYVPGYVPDRNAMRPAEISRNNFIELCAQVTATDEQAYKEMWQRLGLSVDWSLEYTTIGAFSRRISQTSLLRLIEAGHVYQATAPTIWDTDFKTAIAQAEIEDREVQSHFYKVRFALQNGGNFAVATTRPELLAACVAVMVHPEDNRYRTLIGQTALTPLFFAPVPIIADRRAQPEKGTGIVMVCTFGDIADVEWWRDHKLPTRQIIGHDGRILPVRFGSEDFPSANPSAANSSFEALAGSNLAHARKTTEALLRASNYLEAEPIPLTHAVKFYEKGNRPLEIIPTRQWFIRILDKKDLLLKQGESVAWHPPFMLERYRNWVLGLNQDWCISRQRYFGVPFPIWYRLDDKAEPIFSEPILAKPEQLPVDPFVQTPAGFSAEQRGQPHGFGAEMDVLDTWATSSLTPQISTGWQINPAKHDNLFPLDLRPQSHEIIRTWAFYTICMAWLHERGVPWHNVVISGWILDPDRKKMSKSKGNVVTPTALIDTYSADAIRYWAARARAGTDTTYEETIFKLGQRLATKLFHAGRFTFDRLKGHENGLCPAAIQFELDRAFIARLREVISACTERYEKLQWADALAEAESFFWSEFCDDYLELVKARAYQDPLDAKGLSAIAALRVAWSAILRLFAPTLPYITEELWSQYYAAPEGRAQSIHTAPWPRLDELAEIAPPDAPDSLALARFILKEIRRVKGDAKRSPRWPVTTLDIRVPAADEACVRSIIDDVLSAGAVREVRFACADSLACDVTLAATRDDD